MFKVRLNEQQHQDLLLLRRVKAAETEEERCAIFAKLLMQNGVTRQDMQEMRRLYPESFEQGAQLTAEMKELEDQINEELWGHLRAKGEHHPKPAAETKDGESSKPVPPSSAMAANPDQNDKAVGDDDVVYYMDDDGKMQIEEREEA